MKVLVVGSGGREHAICWKINQSPKLTKLYCAPGNGGTSTVAQNIDVDVKNMGALALWAVDNEIDLTVVGPEAPLAAGIADVFLEQGLKVFGPTRQAALLEASKSFAKDVMIRAKVPTPRAMVFMDCAEAKKYVSSEGAPIVIKADGLAAGKGVVVAETEDEALHALDRLMMAREMGSSGDRVVIEEKIEGREASIIALVDGETVLPLVVSQDYKRLNDRNEGPNTGGMGAISPTPVMADEAVADQVNQIIVPVIRDLLSHGIRYTGFLYAGVLVEPRGAVKVLEFNCRLGDPETQPILMRMESDFLEVLKAAVDGRLSETELVWKKQSAACVVCSSKGYPGKVEDGKVISGLPEERGDLVVFHAGTKSDREKGATITKGGRVLGVTALGETLEVALETAYTAVEEISFEGKHYRRDIGRA